MVWGGEVVEFGDGGVEGRDGVVVSGNGGGVGGRGGEGVRKVEKVGVSGMVGMWLCEARSCVGWLFS